MLTVLLCILSALAGFIAGCKLPQKPAEKRNHETDRASREYMNFLTYDGGIQDDIF